MWAELVAPRLPVHLEIPSSAGYLDPQQRPIRNFLAGITLFSLASPCDVAVPRALLRRRHRQAPLARRESGGFVISAWYKGDEGLETNMSAVSSTRHYNHISRPHWWPPRPSRILGGAAVGREIDLPVYINAIRSAVNFRGARPCGGGRISIFSL